METLLYKDKSYPKFQAEGNAAQFAIPFAKHFCKGKGYDVGCNRVEWSLPGSTPIDSTFFDGWDANTLPFNEADYIFSSHCLEHIPNWIATMDYWYDTLRVGGVLFLYLPHYEQEYWRPWNNRKHLHIFTPQIIIDYMKHRGYNNIFHSERDLNDSFIVVGEK